MHASRNLGPLKCGCAYPTVFPDTSKLGSSETFRPAIRGTEEFGGRSDSLCSTAFSTSLALIAMRLFLDRSALAAPRHHRNRKHLRFCGRKRSDPHHLGTQPRALGRISDEFAVALCRRHHRAVHRSRDERAWRRQAGIDPIKVARRLWKETLGMGQRRSQRLALPRPHGAATPSDPPSENEDISAAAAPQEETRLAGLPG
jgi:hypothetical protein